MSNEATEIDVEAEIIGKEKYSIAGGYELQNGMKLQFVGEVTSQNMLKTIGM